MIYQLLNSSGGTVDTPRADFMTGFEAFWNGCKGKELGFRVLSYTLTYSLSCLGGNYYGDG